MNGERYKIILPKFKLPYLQVPNIYKNLLEVENIHTKQVRLALYKIACFFQREFRYDFIQYSMNDDDRESLRSFMFFFPGYYEEKDIAFGGCCFRYRDKWTDVHPHWALQWIWLHPFERSKGHLQEVWDMFVKEFGNFYVEPPLSRAMKFFLRRGKKYSIHGDFRKYLK